MTIQRNRGAAVPQSTLIRVALSMAQMERIAQDLALGAPPHHPVLRTGLTINYTGKVVAKERPRMSGGRAYTPPRTVAFEKAVSAAGQAAMAQANLSRFSHSVVAHLRIIENCPQSWGLVERQLALAGLISPSQNDMDNQIKAIFDGLNKVVFKDDSQLTQLFAHRAYGPEDGFALHINPVGVTSAEIETIKKLYAAEVRKQKQARQK